MLLASRIMHHTLAASEGAPTQRGGRILKIFESLVGACWHVRRAFFFVLPPLLPLYISMFHIYLYIISPDCRPPPLALIALLNRNRVCVSYRPQSLCMLPCPARKSGVRWQKNNGEWRKRKGDSEPRNRRWCGFSPLLAPALSFFCFVLHVESCICSLSSTRPGSAPSRPRASRRPAGL